MNEKTYKLRKPHMESLSDIQQWYHSIIDTAKYVVAMTTRTLNIITHIEHNSGKPFTFDEILEEVPKLVEELKSTGVIPEISLVYDSFEHGRSLSRCLDTLYTRIISAYKSAIPEENQLSNDELDDLLVRAINIDVYNMNEEVLILERKWVSRCRYKNLNDREEFVSTSYDLGSLSQINGEGVYAKAPVEYNNQIGRQYGWMKYESSEFYLNEEMIHNSVYGAIKHFVFEGTHYFEPFVYLPKLDCNQLNSIKNICGLHNIMGEVELFNKLQLLLRYYILRSFINDHELQDVIICQRSEDVDMGLINALDIQGIYDIVNRHNILKYGGNTEHDEVLRRKIEDEVYLKAVLHEHKAKKISHTYAFGGELTLDQLEQTGEYVLDEFIKKFEFGIPVVYNLFRLLDQYKLRVYTKLSEGKVYNVLRITELSLSILPERMATFYPDYYRFARLFWREPDYVERTREYFGSSDPMQSNRMLTQQELSDALKMSEYIYNYRSIFWPLITWDDLFV